MRVGGDELLYDVEVSRSETKGSEAIYKAPLSSPTLLI